MMMLRADDAETMCKDGSDDDDDDDSSNNAQVFFQKSQAPSS
jgi:hypothetical protein